MKTKSFLSGFLIWRIRNIDDRSFILVLSVIIGVGAGIIALIFKTSVFHLQEFLVKNFVLKYSYFLFLIFPIIGITITVIFKHYILKDHIKHNISSILHAISKRNSLMKAHKIYSSVFGAIVTAGFGGSIGLESPIISSGAALGSNIGKIFRLNYKSIRLLLACGASAAIAAIFNTPIAGIVFALEVLLIDLSRFSLIPLLMAAISGAITTKLFGEEEILLEFVINQPFVSRDIPFFIILGILSGLVSFYFTKVFVFIDGKFEKLKNHSSKLIFGAAALGIMIFLFPALYGEGYDTLKLILNGNAHEVFTESIFSTFIDNWLVFVLFFLFLILIKVFATVTTIGAGGIGGIFAPSLFNGAVLGFLFAFIYNSCGFETSLSESNFALVGMASVLGGVLHAPLTGIFLIAEITSGYELIVPLMLSTTISFVTVKRLESNSIITMQLAKRGELITHDKDKAVLAFMKLDKVIETDFIIVPIEATLGNLVKIISKSKRNIFPVVDKENILHGIILLDDVRDIMFNSEMYDNILVRNLMIIPPAYIDKSDSMQNVINKFNETSAWNLPVTHNSKYVGFISKSKLFSSYRKLLMELTEE
ncbi:MAG: chloride channel protein [Bacteroidales bacterium]|nr:chloride channel protein [Bacteroidales bacterium]